MRLYFGFSRLLLSNDEFRPRRLEPVMSSFLVKVMTQRGGISLGDKTVWENNPYSSLQVSSSPLGCQSSLWCLRLEKNLYRASKRNFWTCVEIWWSCRVDFWNIFTESTTWLSKKDVLMGFSAWQLQLSGRFLVFCVQRTIVKIFYFLNCSFFIVSKETSFVRQILIIIAPHSDVCIHSRKGPNFATNF